MSQLSELGDVLVGCRVVSRQQWDAAVRAAGGDAARATALLADEPPDWWDGKPPTPPGLTDYQRWVIETRVAAGELAELRPDLALNQFLLLDKLGEGGQGAVYRARQLNPPRFVAVKTLTRDTERGRQRFEQEARSLIQIRHPAVARFYLYERVRDAAGEPTDDYLMAMEFVDGTNLGQLIRSGGPVPWPFIARWAAELLGGLAEIHKHGFVHRDVKPDNVMAVEPLPGPGVRPEDTAVRLLDFGAVKAVGGPPEEIEGDRVFVGTREYASPEQWAGNAEPASDLYALGGTLFHALTGRPPYQVPNRDAYAFRAAHIKAPVPTIREHDKELPVELARVVRKMMSKAPADRGDALQLAEEFRRLARGSAPARAKPAPVSPPAKPQPAAAKPVPAAAKPRPAADPEPHHSAGFVESVLSVLERIFIPGHHRHAPGDEPGVPERVLALLRRPLVLLVLAVLIAGLVLLIR